MWKRTPISCLDIVSYWKRLRLSQFYPTACNVFFFSLVKKTICWPYRCKPLPFRVVGKLPKEFCEQNDEAFLRKEVKIWYFKKLTNVCLLWYADSALRKKYKSHRGAQRLLHPVMMSSDFGLADLWAIFHGISELNTLLYNNVSKN